MQLQSPSMGDFVSWGVAIVVSLLNYKIKLDIKNEMDTLRKEFAGTFVQQPLATEQRANMTYRLESCEKEVLSNRIRIHEIATEVLKSITGEIFKIQNMLTDKARRMASYEERLKTVENMQHDMANRQSDLSNRVGHLEREKD